MADNVLTAYGSKNSVQPKDLVQTYYSQMLYEQTIATSVYYNIVDKNDVVPERIGDIARWYTFKNMTEGSELTEGVAGDGSYLSTTYVEETLIQKGKYIKVSDKLQGVALFNVIDQGTKKLNQSAAWTVDTLIKNAAIYGAGGTPTTNAFLSTSFYQRNGQYPFYIFSGAEPIEPVWNSYNGSPNAYFSSFAAWTCTCAFTNSNYSLTIAKLQAAKLALKRLNVLPHPDGYFHAVMHPTNIHLIKRDPEFREWMRNQYAKEAFEAGLVGEVDGIKIYDSTRAFFVGGVFLSATQPTMSCYVTTMTGSEAMVCVDFANRSIGSGTRQALQGVEILINRPGEQSTDNPYRNFMTVAYKIFTCAKVLNSDCGINLVTFYGV